MSRGGGGFGEIDLPSVQNDLPNPDGRAGAHADARVRRSLAAQPGRWSTAADRVRRARSADRRRRGRQSGQPARPRGHELRRARSSGRPDAGCASFSMAPGQTLGPRLPGEPAAPAAWASARSISAAAVSRTVPSWALRPRPAPARCSRRPRSTGRPRDRRRARATRGPSFRSVRARGPARSPAGLIALIIVGGAALQFTPVGAFGYVAISDRLHASDYSKNALTAADAARAKMALDTYSSAQQAADELRGAQAPLAS